MLEQTERLPVFVTRSRLIDQAKMSVSPEFVVTRREAARVGDSQCLQGGGILCLLHLQASQPQPRNVPDFLVTGVFEHAGQIAGGQFRFRLPHVILRQREPGQVGVWRILVFRDQPGAHLERGRRSGVFQRLAHGRIGLRAFAGSRFAILLPLVPTHQPGDAHDQAGDYVHAILAPPLPNLRYLLFFRKKLVHFDSCPDLKACFARGQQLPHAFNQFVLFAALLRFIAAQRFDRDGPGGAFFFTHDQGQSCAAAIRPF